MPKELERTNFAEQCAVIEEYLGARQVVFLIDEWDHPMTSHMLEPEKAAIAEAALTRFYAWIARCPNTHFAFVTGISSYHSQLRSTLRDLGGLNSGRARAELR